MNAYRQRLVPFIQKWRRDRTRVAVFGIGAHTTRLFEDVPELASVRIVGYLDSTLANQKVGYRGKRVHAPTWAEGHADVILCSSFVSESTMAEAVEHLSCKIVLSHTPHEGAHAARPQTTVIYRPEPVGRTLEWPDETQAVVPGVATRYRGYLTNSGVVDAVIQQFYPFVEPREADQARAMVRYCCDGAEVVECGGTSPSLTALQVIACAPTGRVTTVAPASSVAATIQLVARFGTSGSPQIRVPRVDASQQGLAANGAGSTLVDLPGDRSTDPVQRAVGHLNAAAQRAGGPLILCVGEPQHSARLILAASRTIRRHHPIIVAAVDFGFVGRGTTAAALGLLEECGYRWTIPGRPAPRPNGLASPWVPDGTLILVATADGATRARSRADRRPLTGGYNSRMRKP
jgi:hypothetical protein